MRTGEERVAAGQVFEEVAPLLASVLDGYSACIFAYGQVRHRPGEGMT